MAQWIFDANDVEEKEFAVIPEGNHRIRVFDVEEKTSSTGKQMYEITLEVSGYAGKVWDYLVFDNTDDSARKRTNNKINSIATTFGVAPQNVVSNPNSIIGKVGGCRIKHTKYNGDTRANVSYYLNAEKTAALPAWKNASGNTANLNVEIIDDDEDVSF